MEKTTERKPAVRKLTAGQIFSELSMPILLVLLIIVFAILSPNFLTPLNLTNILVQNVHIAVCSCAVMMIMVSGGTDLSIGRMVGMGMTAATIICPSPWPSSWASCCAWCWAASTASWARC